MSAPQYPMGEVVPGQQMGWQAYNAGAPGQGMPGQGVPGQGGQMRQFKGEQVPTAPPMDFIGDLPGYEGTSFDGGEQQLDWIFFSVLNDDFPEMYAPPPKKKKKKLRPRPFIRRYAGVRFTACNVHR